MLNPPGVFVSKILKKGLKHTIPFKVPVECSKLLIFMFLIEGKKSLFPRTLSKQWVLKAFTAYEDLRSPFFALSLQHWTLGILVSFPLLFQTILSTLRQNQSIKRMLQLIYLLRIKIIIKNDKTVFKCVTCYFCMSFSGFLLHTKLFHLNVGISLQFLVWNYVTAIKE